MGNSKNKIIYVDPNNIAGCYGKRKFHDNVTWNPEDLNISVDIQVVIPDRNNCGKLDYADGKTWILCPKNKTSFFSGEPFGKDNEGEDSNFFLTDSYTNISYTEIKNNEKGNRELLGVESIDISFDSNFFPQVIIKFTDVRGASLMMPEEANLMTDLENKQNKSGYKEGYKNFFRSLFQFPYPVFYLTVKGFFGTRETFLLSVEDFKSSFNSETGNFDVTVKFIGHMYGIYSDLPLNYLIIAPYIGGNGNEPNEYWKNNNRPGQSFTFSDGTSIPTFIDFLHKFKNLDNSFTEQLKIDRDGYKNIKKIAGLRELKEYLEKIIASKKEYDKYLYDTFAAEGGRVIFSNQNHIILLKKTGSTINIPKRDYSKIISNYNDYVNKNNGETIKGDKCLNFYKNIPDNGTKAVLFQELRTVEDDVYSVSIEKKNLSNKIKVFNGEEEDCSLVFVTEEMKAAIKQGYSYAVVYRKYSNNNEFFDIIKSMIYEIDEAITNAIEEHIGEYNELSKTVLGFSPTIENVFRMIYAHIDCFMHEFYGTLKNIASQEKNGIRKLNALQPHVSAEETDVKGFDNFSLPPFTGFFNRDTKTNLRTKKYPFDYYAGNKQLAEVDFVEQIYAGINGLSLVYEDIKPSENEEPESFENHYFEPLTPLDIIYNGNNPYDCLNQDERQEFLEEIIRVFTYRICVGEYLGCFKDIYKNDKKSDKKTAGEIEKGNILSSLSEGKKNALYQELKQYYDNNNGLNEDKIVEILNDPSLNFSFYDRGKLNGIRTLYSYDSINFPSKTYDIRKPIESVKKVKDYICSSPIKECTNLSTDILAEYYDLEKWEYPQTPFINGILYYDEETRGYARNVENSTDYSMLVNKVVDGILDENDFKMGIIMYGKKSSDIKNLYFEKTYLKELEKKYSKEEMPYKKAEIFLSCIIGNNDKRHPYVDEKTQILRMPKYVRLFLGSQLYFKEISIGKDGTFNNFIKPAKTLNGNDLFKEIEPYYPTAKDEFIEWVKTDFKRIDEILTQYSKDEYAEKIALDGWFVNKWYNPDETYELQQTLVKFYLENIYVLNVCKFSKSENLPIIHPVTINKFIKSLYEELKEEFEITEQEESSNNNNESNTSEEDSERIKEEIYYTQKGLYDKWLSAFKEKRFLLQAPEIDREIAYKKSMGQKVNGIVSEYNSFIYMDSFYNDIGQTFYVDVNELYRLLTEQIGEAEVRTNRSVYEFISDIARENKLLLIALPVYNNFHNERTLVDIFTPHQIYDGNGSAGEREIGNTYLLMYTHEVSHNLDPGETEGNGVRYEDDGFDIADTLGLITEEATDVFCGFREKDSEEYSIPAFGVTYAKQNQSYFKNISLNMESPRQTDFAIYNQFRLAAQEAHGDVNSPVALGQNMYSIYSNRAYDCHVEMMGCINIMPTMYFQLNNVPLFKGAYMITKVEHHIKAGDMTTKFSGTRISKNAIPYLKCALNIEEMTKRLNGGNRSEEPEVVVIGGGENEPINITGPKISKWFTLEELTNSSTANANPKAYPEQFKISEEIKRHLKQVAYFLDGLRDYLGYGIRITSGYRCPTLNKAIGGSNTSAHQYGWAADIIPANNNVKMSEFKAKVREYCTPEYIRFDQCIIEKSSSSEWVHIGIYNKDGKQRHQIFNLDV